MPINPEHKSLEDVAAEWANKVLSCRTCAPYLPDELDNELDDVRRMQAVQFDALIGSALETYARRNGTHKDQVSDDVHRRLVSEIRRRIAAGSALQARLDAELVP